MGLGANLGDPRRQLATALDGLSLLAQPRTVRRSRLYRTAPVGPPGQSDYFNAAAAFDTDLEPLDLLQALQALERAAGRVRRVRWGARTLDLDLLIYGERRLQAPALSLPHPRIAERRFVLLPLADLDPDLVVPGQGTVATLLGRCPPLRAEPVPWQVDGCQPESGR